MIIKPETCTAVLIALAITAFLVLGLLLLSCCHETHVDAAGSTIHVHLHVEPSTP